MIRSVFLLEMFEVEMVCLFQSIDNIGNIRRHGDERVSEDFDLILGINIEFRFGLG